MHRSMDLRYGSCTAVRASPEAQRGLLTLQDIDTRLEVLARSREAIPEVALLAEARQQLATVMSSLAILEGDVEEVLTEVARCESDVEVARQRLLEDEKRLAASTDPKLSVALEHEIETLRKRLRDLEDVELEVMERQEVAEQARSGAMEHVTALTERCRDLDQGIARESERIESEIAAASQLRRDVVSGLPEDLVALYDRQRARYGMGATALVRGVSQASGMTLTEADLDSIRHTEVDEVVICPESSGILVRSDESWT